MNISRKLVILALFFSLPPALLSAASYDRSRGVSGIGDAGSSLGDQKQRLREAHLRQLMLGEEAESLFADFESLAIEALHADEKLMNEIWDSAETTFKLEHNRADDVRDAARYYIEIFKLSESLSEQETALDSLGLKEKGNSARNKAIDKASKQAEKTRKKIKSLRGKIKDRLKSAIQYDEDGEQRRRLNNWLLVSTGLLIDARLDREEKARAAAEKLSGTAKNEAP